MSSPDIHEGEIGRDGRNLASSWPPKGKTYLTIGQDFFSIQEYLLSQYNASLHRPDGHHISAQVGDSLRSASSIFPLSYFHPACTMTYTDIYELKGLDQPADYGSGIEYAKGGSSKEYDARTFLTCSVDTIHSSISLSLNTALKTAFLFPFWKYWNNANIGLAEAFPESGLQIGLWLNGSQGCRDILSGALNNQIYRLFDFIQSDLPKSLPKVFLRVGYEFDNPWFGFSDDPRVYQEAFRALVRVCEIQMTPSLCHEKIVFVWHSWAAPRKDGVSLEQFYPGDSYVDWIGVSIFQQLYPWANDGDNEGGNFAGGNMNEVIEVLEYAKARDKPIMIAESTPFGGMNVTSSNIARKYISDDGSGYDIWNLWFQKTIDLIDEYDISMWSYINCDWDSQPMWRDIGFGDTRLSSSDDVMKHWWDQVLSNDTRFLLRLQGSKDHSSLERSHSDGVDTNNSSPQHGSSRNIVLATATATGFQNDGLSTYAPHFLYSFGFVLLALLVARKAFRSRRRNQVKSSIAQTLNLSSSNGCGEYGSISNL